MEENKLVKALVVLGAVLILTEAAVVALSAPVVAEKLRGTLLTVSCEEGSVLYSPASVLTCQRVLDLQEFMTPDICSGLSGNKKTACDNLVGIAGQKAHACSTADLIEGDVTDTTYPADVQKNCQSLFGK